MFDNASDLDKIVKEKNAPTERNIPQKMKCTAWCTRTLIYCDSRDKEEIYVSNTCSSPRVNIRYDAIRKVVSSFFFTLSARTCSRNDRQDKTRIQEAFTEQSTVNQQDRRNYSLPVENSKRRYANERDFH